MPIKMVLDGVGLIVNFIVIDLDIPGDFSPGTGFIMSDIISEIVQVAQDDGTVENVEVPFEVGGTYLNGIYTPPKEQAL